MFLQVSAVARPEAELLVDVLVKKGFRAAVARGPNELLYRVLVGPASSDTELAKTKGDLEQAGFKPIPRRYGATLLPTTTRYCERLSRPICTRSTSRYAAMTGS